MLRVLANAAGAVKPDLARQVRASLVMDSDDLTFDSASVRAVYPGLPCTSVADILAGIRQSV
jgi:hypothetical protein